MNLKKTIAIALLMSIGAFLYLSFFGRKPTIGILLPTDDVSAHTNARVGFLMAMRELPPDVKFVDVDYTATSLEKVLKNSIRDGIRYFVADNYSSELVGLEGILRKNRAILVESMVTNPNVLKNAKCVYTLAPTDDVQTRAMAAYVRMKGYKSVVLVKGIGDSQYVEYLTDHLTQLLKGINVVSVTFDDLQKVKRAPDLFVFITSTVEAMEAVGYLKARFPRSHFLGSDWTFQNSLSSDPLMKGFITVGFVDPIYLKVKMSRLSGISVTPNSILAYDALRVAYILATKGIGCSKVKKYLEDHTFLGLTGPFSFDGFHANMPVYFYKVTASGLRLAWKFGG